MFGSGREMSPAQSSGMIGASQTLTERLRSQRDAMKLKLAELEDALTAIESNPEVQRVVDALHKLNF